MKPEYGQGGKNNIWWIIEGVLKIALEILFGLGMFSCRKILLSICFAALIVQISVANIESFINFDTKCNIIYIIN